MPPTRPVKLAYMPAGPGSGSRTSAGQARAGSLQCWGSCQRMWVTSAGESSSQVWPKARPAAWPVAQTSAPAPAAAPRPMARSWSPGLVNGGYSGGRCPAGGRDGQGSCCIRATPRRRLVVGPAVRSFGEEGAVLVGMRRDQAPSRSRHRATHRGFVVQAEGLAAGTRGTLPNPVTLAHPRQRDRVLAATPIGRLGARPLVGFAVGGELSVQPHVEGARRPALAAVWTALAWLSYEGKRVVTIGLHLGVHSLGLRGPGAGVIRPRAASDDGQGSAGEPGCQRTCKRNPAERHGTRWDRTAPRRANVPAQSRCRWTERHRPARALRCS